MNVIIPITIINADAPIAPVVVPLNERYYLGFIFDGNIRLAIDGTSRKAIRCTSNGSVGLLYPANCNGSVSFEYLDSVPSWDGLRIETSILKTACQIDGDLMPMTLRMNVSRFYAVWDVPMALPSSEAQVEPLFLSWQEV